MTVIWTFPTRVLFGAGTVAETGREAKTLGASRALVVTDPGVREAGLVEAVTAALEKAELGAEVFDGVSTNPQEREVLAALEKWKEAKCDVVVAVGGGSVMDVAKLVRLIVTHPLPLGQYDGASGGTDRIVKQVPRMIAIPTTAGTGSEVARSSVVTLEQTGRKTIVDSPKLIPDVAILDPELTLSMPPKVTAATGFEALAECIESYCAKGDHPMADALALEAISLVAGHLERAVNDGKDITARGEMMKAAMMAAVALEKGLGACHSLAHALGSELGMHHGLASALCLPAVIDFNRGSAGARLARVAKTLGARGEDDETLCFECSGAVRALRRKVGLPEGLTAAGVEESQLPRLASLAILDVAHQLNPRPCTEDDMLALYKASM